MFELLYFCVVCYARDCFVSKINNNGGICRVVMEIGVGIVALFNWCLVGVRGNLLLIRDAAESIYKWKRSNCFLFIQKLSPLQNGHVHLRLFSLVSQRRVEKCKNLKIRNPEISANSRSFSNLYLFEIHELLAF